MKRIGLLLIFLTCTLLNSLAQTSECACCDEAHKHFDFWIGEWIVKDSTGTVVGENRITKIEGNCVVQEQWIGTSGTTGTSMNYFDPADNTWNQLWLDNGGNQLQLKGQFREGKMVLRSEMFNTTEANHYNQITWSENNDGTVTQLWQVFDVSNKPLQTLFKGIYHRKK